MPGQHSLLLEHRAAYRTLDEAAGTPRIVLAIGGRAKRRFLHANEMDIKNSAIGLKTVAPNTIAFDCELHNTEVLSPAKAGPESECSRSHHIILRTNSRRPQIAKFSWELYWWALIPFASTVLLFKEDLGSWDTVFSILAAWAVQSIGIPVHAPPRILLLHDGDSTSNVGAGSMSAEICARIKTALLAMDPFDQTVHFQADFLYKTAFEAIHALPASASRSISAHIEKSFSNRLTAGYAYRSEHLKRLFEDAVAQFPDGRRRPFDVYRAIRALNPIPEQIEDRIVDFMNLTYGLEIDRVKILASALNMDACPPGMHSKFTAKNVAAVACYLRLSVSTLTVDLDFDLKTMFQNFYGNTILRAAKRLGIGSFPTKVCDAFSKLTLERRSLVSYREHLQLISEATTSWATIHPHTTCLGCLARPPNARLPCGHRLCDKCIRRWGKRAPDETHSRWGFRLPHCPFCHKACEPVLPMRPCTAGIRILKLDGIISSRYTQLRFLKELQRLAGLGCCPIRDQFDLVIGANSGKHAMGTEL